MWDWAIRSGQVHRFLPLLETVLDRFGSGGGAMPGRLHGPPLRQDRMPRRSSSAGDPILLNQPSTTFSGSILSNISSST